MSELLTTYEQFEKSGIIGNINYNIFNAFLLTHHSTRIEGSTLTELDTRLLLEKGITPAGKPLEHANMVKDHFDALTYVTEKAKNKEAITDQFIKEIGARVNKTTGKITNTALGSFDDSKGEYRLANAFAGTDYFLAFSKIADHVKKLCILLQLKIKEVKSVDEVYNLSFDAHFYLVEIHPFGDGNGRTSRLLMNYIQSYHNLPLIPVFAEDKADYIGALKASRAENNTSAIRKFMTTQAIKYFKHEINAQKSMSQGISFMF